MTIDLFNKCLACIHAPVCANNLGGADLDVVGNDCQHYAPNIKPLVLPTKFYLICDVPGFYDITEYTVTKVVYAYGELEKMWGSNPHSSTVAYANHLGLLVFWTREEAQARIDFLIKERRNGNDGLS